jgi:predicted ATPase
VVARLLDETPLWIARGQCIAHYGSGEAYLPILDALGQLCRDATDVRVLAVLKQYAPTWGVHLPAYQSATEREALQRHVQGATSECMLREIVEALEVLTAVQPLVLLLEDLHWSDMATLDLLAWLARRRQPARLLLVGTYRPVDLIVRQHPLRAITQELALHHLCTELPLELLNHAEVRQYLTTRYRGQIVPETLASVLYQRTEGNPLFLVTLVETLERQGSIWGTLRDVDEALRAVPQSLGGMVEQQLMQCSAAERGMLEVASVVGGTFAAATLAASVEELIEAIEHCCSTLASQGQFLWESGIEEWPDGTVTACYSFRHALYQQVIYEQIAPGRRRRLHQQIGQQLEAGFGAQVGERAAELAVHFEHGRDARRAVQYLHQAAENAVQRHAPHEVTALVTKGLALLAARPETSAWAQQELNFQLTLGPALMATKGPAAPEVDQTYARARALCAQVGETAQLFPTLRGLWRFYLNRGTLQTARELGEQLLGLAQHAVAPTALPEAHAALGTTLFYVGAYGTALAHLAQGFPRTALPAQQALGLRHGEAPGVRCLALAAWTLWCLGWPTQALRRGQEALAQASPHPYSLAMAQNWMIYVHYRRRDAPAVQAQAEALLTLATAQQFPLYVGHVTCWRGWALALQGHGASGIEQLRQGMAGALATGQTLVRPLCLGLLAEAMESTGQVDEGLRVIAEALVAIEASGRDELLAEAYRLQGVLRLRQAVPDMHQAEACFQQALDVARRQQAKSWELRAAMSLSRLWQQQGKHAEAGALLAPVYSWFTEGFDTADLQEAKVLLDELGG